MVKSVISLERMVEIYVNSELDIDTWNMFRNMCIHDLITDSLWEKFYLKCLNWVFNDDNTEIIDITYEDAKVIYRRNENGHLVKA